MEGKQLESLLNTLDLVLHDQVLEQDGITLEFYWDTSDVRNALLGKAAFYDYDETSTGKRVEVFNRARFQDERTFVHCLEGAGWFGPIKLLQPHQVELYKLINKEFEIGPVGPPTGGEKKFLTDVGLTGSKEINLDQLGKLAVAAKLTTDQLSALLRRQAGSAPTLFKAVQSAKHKGWKSRLSKWVGDGLLQIDAEAYDYRSLLETKEFDLLQKAFATERPEKAANNFSDAIALCQLAEKARDFEKGKKTIPRFFSRRLDNDVIKQTNLRPHFKYSYENRSYSIFRDTEYYKLRATLSRSEHVETNPKAASQALGETREKLSDIRNAQRMLTPEALNTIIVAGQQLGDVLRRLREYWFLEQVWLPFAAATEVMDVIKEYVQAGQDLNKSRQFREAIEAEVHQIMVRLEHESSEYQRFSQFWNELQTAAIKAMPGSDVKSQDLFKEEGVLRFGFWTEIASQIEQLLAKSISASASSRNSALMDLFRRYQGLKSSSNNNDLMVLTGVLWALHMDDEIIELLQEDRLEDRHYSLSIVFGAACLRSEKHILEIPGLIKRLEQLYDTSADTNTKLDLAIGLAYLYFNYRAYMTKSQFALDERQRNEHLQKAVGFAKIAASTESSNLKKKAYATNQHLFYMLHGPKMFEGQIIQEAAEQLLSFETFEQKMDIWQYRYDDTLATYFEYLADISKARQRWLELALERMDKAWEGGHRNKYVARHRERLMMKAEISR
jgi:hypothetical protein